jgi:hypothetical protein
LFPKLTLPQPEKTNTFSEGSTLNKRIRKLAGNKWSYVLVITFWTFNHPIPHCAKEAKSK